MSYDINLVIDTGGECPANVCEVGNITYNVSPMFELAMGVCLGNLEGKQCSEILPLLEKAVTHINASENDKRYKELNPSNGWGSHEGAAKFLTNLYHCCKQHPKASVRIS